MIVKYKKILMPCHKLPIGGCFHLNSVLLFLKEKDIFNKDKKICFCYSVDNFIEQIKPEYNNLTISQSAIDSSIEIELELDI